jgi:hypothetical protein
VFLAFSVCLVVLLLHAGPQEQGQKIDFDFTPKVDLEKYSTYAWSKEQRALDNLANHIRLINAIQAQMKDKGFRIDPVKPDARIRYRLERRTAVQGRSTQERSVYDPSQLKVQIDLNKEETVELTIELVDAEGGFLLWQAKGNYPLGTPDRAEKQIYAAVEDLFTKYPSEKKK